MTHVMVVPADRGGCGYYRLIWPAQAVSAVRPDWTVSIVQPERIQAGFVDGKFVGVKGFPDPLPDLLVMQRVGTPGQLEVMRWASQNGVATVLDFDDAMWCIDKGNAAWKSWNMANPHNQHWKICETAAQVADLVTVTTDALAQHYGKRHRRTEILPNCIPLAATKLALAGENEVFTAGWAGFTQTHPNDCRVSAPAARAVLDAGGALRVVADAQGAAAEWGIGPAHVESIPPQKLGPDYYTALARLDLMLVGLQDTPFNRSKSTLKVLEAAAMGVPSIAPDNPPHRALAKKGFPLALVNSPSEWADAAKRFKAEWDSGSPMEIRDRFTLAVEDGYTIEGNAERWAQAWERAMNRKNA